MSVNRAPIGPTEREISIRLGAIRRFHRKTQDELAIAIGLTRDQLANIETGRTQLRFLAGWKACRELDIDPWYLATGNSPQGPFHELEIQEFLPELENRGFREVCVTVLQDDLRVARDATVQAQRLSKAPKHQNAPSGELESLIAGFYGRIPNSARALLIQRLVESFEHFLQELSANSQKTPLTNVTAYGKFSDVKTMANLLQCLNKATQQRGMKSKLAKFMGVPLANVSQWLSGEREPGGETTLRLLHWVEQQERSTK